jgi:hypothetical protein
LLRAFSFSIYILNNCAHAFNKMKRRSDKRDIDVERETPEESMDEEEDDFSDENNPPTIDPYEVLGLETNATADDVKKAYRKMALKHHPGTYLTSSCFASLNTPRQGCRGRQASRQQEVPGDCIRLCCPL